MALLSADGSSYQEVLTPTTIFTVFVGQAGFSFSPDQVTIQVGDQVHWVWSSMGRTVGSGSNCVSDNLFCSPNNTSCSMNTASNTGATYDRIFLSQGTFPFFCRPHCSFGMTGTVFVGVVPGGIVEATNLRIAKSGTNTVFTYTPACGATSHAIYYGEGALAPIGPAWQGSICTDASGSTTIDIGNPTDLQYFVVVGQTATKEGSSARAARTWSAPSGRGRRLRHPQVIASTCPRRPARRRG